jgi:Putative peptidoglycan binding domain/CHAP domain
MTTKEAIQWFKTTFNKDLKAAVVRTPFSIDMLAAIAQQETGYIWSTLLKHDLRLPKILELCVGDTIDKGRGAFPKTKSDLLAAPQGAKMFAIARQALVEMAQYVPGYARVVRDPDKFCHGFGIFQYDLQFFQNDPLFFLRKKWRDFSACAAKCVEELSAAMKRQGWANKITLSDEEKVYVAIAYNAGRANPKLGFKQGHRSDDRKYYGENIAEYLALAQTISPRASASTTLSVAGTNLESPVAAVPEKPRPLLRLGYVGDEVKMLQSLLRSQGYFAAVLGGHFQKKTRQAVLAFQRAHLGRDGKPLEVDGEVGDDTWWALYHPSGKPQKSNIPAILPAGLTPMRAKVLKVAAAEHQAGIHEIPDGSNWGDGVIKYLEEGGSPANPWCCFFWSWCVHRALGAHAFGKPMGSVLSTWQLAKTKGWAMDKTVYAPVPGDAFVMLYKDDSGKLKGTGHIGFVLRADKARNPTAFNTVEGNCGNRVKVGRRQMDQSTLVGFINQYSQEKESRGWKTGLVTADDVGAEGTR